MVACSAHTCDTRFSSVSVPPVATGTLEKHENGEQRVSNDVVPYLVYDFYIGVLPLVHCHTDSSDGHQFEYLTLMYMR